MLQDEGIMLTTDTVIYIEKILVKKDIDNLLPLSELKFLLSPLICRNKEDQEIVYKVFDKLDIKALTFYKECFEINVESKALINNDNPNDDKKKLVILRIIKKSIVTVTVLIFLLLFLKLFRKDNQPQISVTINQQQIVLNDSVNFIANIDTNYNKKNIIIDWKFNDTIINNRSIVNKKINILRDISGIIYLKSIKGTLFDSSKFYFPVLCEPTQSITISEMDFIVEHNKTKIHKKKFIPIFSNNIPKGSNYTYSWYVNDVIFSHDSILYYSDSFTSIKLLIERKNIFCNAPSIEATISNSLSIDASIFGDKKLKLKRLLNIYNVLVSLFLLLVPAIVSLLIYKLIVSSKKLKTNYGKIGTEGPYNIKFNNQEENIHEEQDIKKFSDILRKRHENKILKLDFRKTIRTTISAGGIPKLEFLQLSESIGFLILIDKEKPNSHLIKLFEYLIQILEKSEINIFVYYYNKVPLHFNNTEMNQEFISLQKLMSLFPDTTLIVFGDAQNFINFSEETLGYRVINGFDNWQSKIFVSSYTKGDWDINEKLLIDSGFVVLPADLSSLVDIEKVISHKIEISWQNIKHIKSGYHSRFVDFQNFETLKTYLNDDTLLLWICSLAVYPSIDWNFTLAMGKAIEQQLQLNGENAELINYTNLLKISRISWMQDEVISESLRVEMLLYLDEKKSEVLARETLKKQLELIENTIKNNSFIKARFEIHKRLNKFLLDKNQQRKISNEDYVFIENILKKNQIDEAQDIYFNTPNSLIPHPFQKGKNIGLRNYFKEKEKKGYVYFFFFLVVLFASSFLFLKNKTNYFKWYYKEPVNQVYIINLNDKELSKNIQISMYYTHSGLAWGNKISILKGLIDTLQYDAVTINDTTTNGILNIEDNYGHLLSRDSFKLNSNFYTINIKKVLKIPLKIYYKDASSFSLATSIAEKLSLNFAVEIQQQNFRDTSIVKVFYFSPEYEEKSLLVTNIINDLFQRNFKPQKADSSYFLKSDAKIILYVNNNTSSLSSCTPIAVNGLSDNLNEIWHSDIYNRLVRINLKQRTIYYSENKNNKKLYGTYNINEICLTKTGSFKIIAKTLQGYQLFFIRNVKAQSFELSVCQDLTSTKELLQKVDDADCNNFDKMTLFYENDVHKIYLPVLFNDLNYTEKLKIDKLADSIQKVKRTNSSFTYKIDTYKNILSDTPHVDNFLNYLVKKNIRFPVSVYDYKITGIDPFARDFLIIQTNQTTNSAPVQQNGATMVINSNGRPITIDPNGSPITIVPSETKAKDSSEKKTLPASGNLYVPNTFYPDSSEKALRTFMPKSSNLASYNLKIFDKFGKLVFETSDLKPDGSPKTGWNGTDNRKLSPPGVYVWTIEAKFIDGTFYNGQLINKGNFMLVR